MKLPRHSIAYLFLFIQVIVAILFFDPKLHIGGDDADYLIAARDFLQGSTFPSWHGSFYPIFISFFMAVFGMNVILYKILSLFLLAGSLLLLYAGFCDKIPKPVMVVTLATIAVNASLAFYGSTTYSEPLFIFLQSLFIFLFFKIVSYDRIAFDFLTITSWVLLVMVMFLLSITRNIGMGVILAVVFYFLCTRRWKQAAFSSLLFLIFHGIFMLYKKIVWSAHQVGIEGQLGRIAYKNFYDPTSGSEDFAGFVLRFWHNSNLYLSKHLLAMFGLRSNATVVVWPWFTVLSYLLFVVLLRITWKKNRSLFFIQIYLGTMIAVTFVTQQVHWDQERLILVYFPLVVILTGYAIYDVTTRLRIPSFWRNAILVLIPLCATLRMMVMEKNLYTAWTNITKDKYAGYGSEWRNYAEISEWVGENISDTAVVLCRKPGFSSVLGKRKFTGVSRFHDSIPDSAVSFLKRRHIDYVVMDNLGMNAVQILLGVYLQKNPLALSMVKKIGDINPCFVFKISEDVPGSDNDYLSRLLVGTYVEPNSPYYYTMIGDKLIALGRHENAFQFYDQALKVSPGNSQVLIRRSIASFNIGDHDQAYTDARDAVKAEPGNGEYTAILRQIEGLLRK
ncbi:MAG: tetratricopeptide repeat protein [Bacteroidota bacterium]